MSREDSPYPLPLMEGAASDDELAARIGRYEVLQELGFFGIKTSLKIARGEYEGRFNAVVRRKFSNIYGDVGGCDVGDIEVAAEMLDVFSDIYDYELKDSPDGE